MSKSKQKLISGLKQITKVINEPASKYFANKALKEYRETEQSDIIKTVQHYKGGLYNIITVAEHTETGEELIIYTNLEKTKTYARPKAMFWEEWEDNKTIYKNKIGEIT